MTAVLFDRIAINLVASFVDSRCIANPSGINVNGGGFINAGRALLTTGTPIVNGANGGSLDGYIVQRGNTSDARMQALAGASAALNVYNNADAIGKSATALASGNPQNAASITVSIGREQLGSDSS